MPLPLVDEDAPLSFESFRFEKNGIFILCNLVLQANIYEKTPLSENEYILLNHQQSLLSSI